MLQIIVRRILITIPVVILVSMIVFSLLLLVPGDPAITIAGDGATQEAIDATRERLGLNDPVIVQYWHWLTGAVQGDLGSSLFSSQQVTSAILQRLPATLSLTGGALAVSLLVGVPAGILTAVYRGSWFDRTLSVGVAGGLAMPNYFFGMLLILFFAIWNTWLPASGYVGFSESPIEWARHLLLPWITLGVSSAAVITRQLRSSMIGVLSEDYVRTARSKGLRNRAIYLKHSAKNASVPVVTVVGGQVAFALGGAVVVEQVFGIAGIGRLVVNAVFTRDIPLVQGIVVMFTIIVLITNLLVDILYGYFNPKVRVR